MKNALPVNPKILEWARITMGMSISMVASKMGQSEKVIVEWESGKSSPTYPQLENLAYQVYKRPVALFFFPEIPQEESPKTAFRTLPAVIVENLPPETIQLYRKAKLFQLNLEELFDGVKPVDSSILGSYYFKNEANIPLISKNIRNSLGISIEKQFSWQSVDEAFGQWRMAFEDNGTFVFKDAFRNDDYSGFCLYDDKYPIIYINNSMPFSRQIFTLFHELGHLLYHLGGIDFREKSIMKSTEKEYQTYEVNCNRFANEFLVPAEVFKSQDLTVSVKCIEKLADKFSVSREVVLRNYLELGLINADYYNEMAEKWTDDAKKSRKQSEGGNYYYTRKSYLGDTYIKLAFSKYYKKKITLENLSEYLHIKVRYLSKFEQHVFE